MRESMRRCRYYPDCEIHLGEIDKRWFTADEVAEMRELRENEGLLIRELAARFSCGQSTVRDVLKGRSYGLPSSRRPATTPAVPFEPGPRRRGPR